MKLPRSPRLLRTTALRVALQYLLVYALVLGAALGAMFWWTQERQDPRQDQALRAELAQLVGMTDPARRAQAVAARASLGSRLYLLADVQGRVLAGGWLRWPEAVDTDGHVQRLWIDEELLPPGRFDDDAHLPIVAARLGDGSRVLVAGVVDQPGALYEVAEYLFESLPLALLLALALGAHTGYAILRRMDAVGRTAGEIMRGDLSRRVPIEGRNDEFDALAARLNAMLDRVQQLLRGMREVTDNIAHDLRSPLARLRNQLEVSLLEPRSEADYRAAIARAIEDSEQLIRTFNALLGIAQIEAGAHRGEWTQVDLSALADDLADLYAPAAEDKGQALRRENGAGVCVTGSRQLLAQALGNLLDNAVKYTPDGGTIRLRVGVSDSAPFVSVADNGPGIPAAEREHVLERFVRLQDSRDAAGNGLGLSLVKAVACIHKAALTLDDDHPGLVVTLRFSARAA